MFSRLPFALIVFYLLTCFASAQTGPINDGKDGLEIQAVPESPETYEASWWGRSGRTYYLLRSVDLVTWEYFTTIETGSDAVIRYGFTSESPRVFIRLRYEDEVYANPYVFDSDGDGLTNQQEFTSKTDPFNADSDGDGLLDKWEINHGFDPLDKSTGSDADGDGLPDVWENYYFLNLSRDGTGDFDSDDICDKQEFLLGTKPDNAAVISTAIGLSVRNLE